jgi:hypothetical protein
VRLPDGTPDTTLTYVRLRVLAAAQAGHNIDSITPTLPTQPTDPNTWWRQLQEELAQHMDAWIDDDTGRLHVADTNINTLLAEVGLPTRQRDQS